MSSGGRALLEVHVSASADDVWALVRRFGEVGEWNPFLASSRVAEGREDRIGAIREVVTGDGVHVREELLELDDGLRALGYRMLTFAIPVTAQRNRIVVTPGGDGCSVVTFSAEFDPASGTTAAAVADMNRVAFSAAAEGIGVRLGAKVAIVGR